MSPELPDVEIVDVDDWGPEPTRPGLATTADLVAEAATRAQLRLYLDEMDALEQGGDA